MYTTIIIFKKFSVGLKSEKMQFICCCFLQFLKEYLNSFQTERPEQ